jgi:hypothetical protein
VGVLHALALTINDFMNASPAFPVGILYLAVACIPVTLLHELGHATVVRHRLGGEVQITVGSAVKIAEFRLGEISASIHAFERPDRVAGIVRFDATSATPADIAWIALGGPIASLIGLLWAIPFYNIVPRAGIVHGIVWGIVLGSLFGVVLNLIPFEIQERRGQARKRTDGRLFLQALSVASKVR